MKTLTLYNGLSPMFGNGGFGPDPFELVDRLFDFVPAAGKREPAIDVREEDKGYVLEIELPGLSEKDVKLEIKDGALTLSTAKKEEKEGGLAGKWLRRERRTFDFSTSFLIPEDADPEATQARLKDGLLTVELPKKPETAPRTVPVKVA